jgi:hypothetical protein
MNSAAFNLRSRSRDSRAPPRGSSAAAEISATKSCCPCQSCWASTGGRCSCASEGMARYAIAPSGCATSLCGVRIVRVSETRASNSVGWSGFARIVKSCPASRAVPNRSIDDACPENSRILHFGKVCLIATARSIPLMPGIATSVSRRSGGTVFAISSALFPSYATRALTPLCSRIIASVSAITASSSTTSTTALGLSSG